MGDLGTGEAPSNILGGFIYDAKSESADPIGI